MRFSDLTRAEQARAQKALDTAHKRQVRDIEGDPRKAFAYLPAGEREELELAYAGDEGRCRALLERDQRRQDRGHDNNSTMGQSEQDYEY